ncbi:hypothetical protein ACFWBH_01420 [Streptomyces sp. NPDC059999]|uniref:hypothetical protein n=1 Tax=Streptomyces sp. NPDC059999 TaxID=3347030 RepID=UPI0036C5FC7E
MNTTVLRTLAALALATAALTLSGTAHAADVDVTGCSGETCSLHIDSTVTIPVDYDANQNTKTGKMDLIAQNGDLVTEAGNDTDA